MFKICDAIHGFIRFDALEKRVIDTQPFQRLRYVHQMGVAYLVYPGATHARLEHSLGVMEVATRIFDTLMAPNNRPDFLKEIDLSYWRRVLRLAALCHDMGHLPFSHTAEKELLPDRGHEGMTIEIIQSPCLSEIWSDLGPHAAEDIIKLAVSNHGLDLSPWEKVLSQVITEDNFGADRIDYLIRDARYTGVGSGHFDYHQLLDCLRIVQEKSGSLAIGILSGGIQSVESLWMARYLMYARVYHHPKARVYTNHMRQFMERHYKKAGFPETLDRFLRETDYKVLTALALAAEEGDEDAQVLLKVRPAKEALTPTAAPLRKGSRSFPVVDENGKIMQSTEFSEFLSEIPVTGSQR